MYCAGQHLELTKDALSSLPSDASIIPKMVNYKQLARQNADVSIVDQRALISGGTQGIGAGIALRFALAGANVWLIGRNEDKAKEVLKQLEQASAEARRRAGSSAEASQHEFFQADLSSPAGVSKVANRIADKAGKGGIDYLIETQGGPPRGSIEKNEHGIESQFAVQVISRVGLAKILTEKQIIKRGIYMVAFPSGGGKKAINVDDIDNVKTKEAGKWWGGLIGMMRKGTQESAILDSACQSLAERNPNLTVCHAFPGFVLTDALSNQGHNSLFVMGGKLFGPLLAYKPGPGGYAEVPFHVLTHPEGQRYLETGSANYLGAFLSKYQISPCVKDKSVREQIWDKLGSYF